MFDKSQLMLMFYHFILTTGLTIFLDSMMALLEKAQNNFWKDQVLMH